MKKVKLAMIRNNKSDPCPFGLSIPFGCKHAGNVIDNMAPLALAKSDEQQDRIKKANNRLLQSELLDSAEEPVHCKYSTKIIDIKEAVECNFTDVAPGMGTSPLFGPAYNNEPMAPFTMNGLRTYPIGYSADYNISRNLYFGIMSLQGNDLSQQLQSLAKEVDLPEAAMVLFYCPEDQTALLLKRSKVGNHNGFWGLPGGHLKKGEIPAAGLVRELNEEIGFSPNITDCISVGSVLFEPQDHGNCVVFVIAIKKDAKDNWDIQLNKEHSEYKWFDAEQIPEKLHPVAEFILRPSANISA